MKTRQSLIAFSVLCLTGLGTQGQAETIQVKSPNQTITVTIKADIFQDGPNAGRYGQDFKRVKQRVTASDTLTIQLAPGGGWAACLTR